MWCIALNCLLLTTSDEVRKYIFNGPSEKQDNDGEIITEDIIMAKYERTEDQVILDESNNMPMKDLFII